MRRVSRSRTEMEKKIPTQEENGLYSLGDPPWGVLSSGISS